MSPVRLALLITALAVPSASAAVNGSYKGDTEQNRSVTFTIKKNKVRDFQAGMGLWCTTMGNQRLLTDAIANLPAIPIKGGRFDHAWEDDAGEGEVHGRIKGTKVTGTVSLWRGDTNYESGQMYFGACSADDLKFTAKRG
jgi:hypothetical protein